MATLDLIDKAIPMQRVDIQNMTHDIVQIRVIARQIVPRTQDVHPSQVVIDMRITAPDVKLPCVITEPQWLDAGGHHRTSRLSCSDVFLLVD